MIEAKAINLKEVVKYFDTLPEDTFDIAKKEMSTALFKADKKIKIRRSLKKRTGALMKSIQVRVQGTNLKNLQASIYTTSVYAPVHEYGATIKAKNAYKNVPGGPYLNIPTDANKTAAGVMRKSATQVFAAGGFIVKFKSGKYGLMLNGEVVFTFHKLVHIPARLKMIKTTEDQIPTMLSRIADQIGED